MGRTVWLVSAAAITLGVASSAGAQGTRSPSKNPIYLPEVQITGRAGMAVEVARIPPTLARAQSKRPLLTKLEEAAYKEPF